jgi:Flp pilus assembly protein CpaB
MVPFRQLPAHAAAQISLRLRSTRPGPVWLPHPLVRVLRQPAIYWGAAAILTALTFYVVTDLSSDARATLAAYGPRERVLVVTAPVGPGDPLAPDNVEWREVPVGLIPTGAVRDVPADAAARIELFPGEVVVEPRLAGGGSGIAALLPKGTTAMALPVGAGLPPVVVGDLVDVIASFIVAPEDGSGPSFAVASGASVVHIGERAVSVAVAQDESAAVAYALAHGIVTLALIG